MGGNEQTLNLLFREQRLERDENGYTVWRVREQAAILAAAETALLLCDVWDNHWCRGANERLAKMLPRMNDVCRTLRARGVLIVHAPSETMDFYKDAPTRLRALAAPPIEPPADLPHDTPPKPFDSSGGGGDTSDNPGAAGQKLWTRQHPAIEIDQERDVISDKGRELYNVYRQRGVHHVLIMGAHTNMCILGRSFAIQQLVRWGFRAALVRDLTDAMYDPAKPPYVSHEEGTRLAVEYIEKFWCPTVTSADLLK